MIAHISNVCDTSTTATTGSTDTATPNDVYQTDTSLTTGAPPHAKPLPRELPGFFFARDGWRRRPVIGRRLWAPGGRIGGDGLGRRLMDSRSSSHHR